MLIRYIVHADRDPEHGCQGHQPGAKVTIGEGSMIGSPVGHYRIDIPEVPFPGEAWHKPGGWPGGIGTLGKCVMHLVWKVDGMPLCDLQGRAKPLDDIDPTHGNWHSTLGIEGR